MARTTMSLAEVLGPVFEPRKYAAFMQQMERDRAAYAAQMEKVWGALAPQLCEWQRQQAEKNKRFAVVAPFLGYAMQSQPIPQSQLPVIKQQLDNLSAILLPGTEASTATSDFNVNAPKQGTREPKTLASPDLPLQQRRKKPKKYSNRECFVQILGDVINALRLRNPSREPTLEEIAHPSYGLSGASLWPEGISRTTLKARLKFHQIILDTFLAELPWPTRPLP